MGMVHKLWMMIQSRPRMMKVEELLKRNKLLGEYFVSVGGGVVMSVSAGDGKSTSTTTTTSYQPL